MLGHPIPGLRAISLAVITATGRGLLRPERHWVPRPGPHEARGAFRGGRGSGQETAAFTSSATFFSTVGLHFLSA